MKSHVNLPDIASDQHVRRLVKEALAEDVGRGDVTSDAMVGEGEAARALILSRGDYVLSGGPVAELVFATCDAGIRVRRRADDGDPVTTDTCVMELQGPARSLLAAERTALNFLQRMSGIATTTRRFVQLAARNGVDVLDTRKTTPTLRVLEKYAVLCGGGRNHRMGLYDRVLIKDNHRVFWRRAGGGSLADAVRAARERHPGVPVEVEVESEKDLEDVLAASPDWVLLDNMPPERMGACVDRCAGRCRVEASGGLTLENIVPVLRTGIDAVSLGALTHSAPAADFSLEFCDEEA